MDSLKIHKLTMDVAQTYYLKHDKQKILHFQKKKEFLVTTFASENHADSCLGSIAPQM